MWVKIIQERKEGVRWRKIKKIINDRGSIWEIVMVVVDFHDNSRCISSVFIFYCSLLDPGGWIKSCQVSWGIYSIGMTSIFHKPCVLTGSAAFPLLETPCRSCKQVEHCQVGLDIAVVWWKTCPQNVSCLASHGQSSKYNIQMLLYRLQPSWN